MKHYCVDMDVTFSSRIYVYAKDEESAKSIALNQMNNDPYYNTRMRAWVGTEVIDVFEEVED